VPKRGREEHHNEGDRPWKNLSEIGVDLAKNYFQVHALASEGSPAVKRKVTRSKMHRFFSQIEPSFIGMEACGSAHYWARELRRRGMTCS
jgi:transposase